MAFREKSAWVMGLLMAAAGVYYLNMLLGAARAFGGAPPPAGIFAAYVVLVVVGSIVAQIVLAVASPKEAAAPADERERIMLQRAGHWSGFVLGAGAVTALLHFLAYGDGNALFHILLGSLIVSQVAEYAFQIALLRRGG
jgi:hypothetical protein